MSVILGSVENQDGTYKARVTRWVWTPLKADSQSVGIEIDFVVVSQYDFANKEWVSWEGTDEHTVKGWWYVVGRDGSANQTAVGQIVRALGWDGNPDVISEETPPPADKIVQITVKTETFDGKERTKASWLDAEDRVPGGATASPEERQTIGQRYGALFRGLAASEKAGAKATAGAPAKPAMAPPKRRAAAPVTQTASMPTQQAAAPSQVVQTPPAAPPGVALPF